MPNRSRTSLPRSSRQRWLPPLPHPSWSGEPRPAGPHKPLAAAEFWSRLGL